MSDDLRHLIGRAMGDIRAAEKRAKRKERKNMQDHQKRVLEDSEGAIVLRQFPNGGWIVSQGARDPARTDREIGAYTTVVGMLEALRTELVPHETLVVDERFMSCRNPNTSGDSCDQTDEVERLRAALTRIRDMKPHHAGQTANECHMQHIAFEALRGDLDPFAKSEG